MEQDVLLQTMREDKVSSEYAHQRVGEIVMGVLKEERQQQTLLDNDRKQETRKQNLIQ